MIAAQNRAFLPSVCLLGIRIHTLSVDDLLTHISCVIHSDNRVIIANVNINAMNLSYDLPWFRAFLDSAEVVFCDGDGVMLGARIMGYCIPQRITYADWMWQLAEFAEPRDFTFFFLGAHPGIVDKAAGRIKERFPNLHIVGTHHGYFDKTPASPENKAVIQKINAVRPNILIVGFGMPLQERWLMENWEHVEANVALTGGAVFDYVSGELHRGPRWMTDHSLEWLARLIIEPRRLWKRYIIGNPLFLLRVLREKAGHQQNR